MHNIYYSTRRVHVYEHITSFILKLLRGFLPCTVENLSLEMSQASISWESQSIYLTHSLLASHNCATPLPLTDALHKIPVKQERLLKGSVTTSSQEMWSALPSSSLSLSRKRASMRNLSSVPKRDCSFRSWTNQRDAIKHHRRKSSFSNFFYYSYGNILFTFSFWCLFQ